MRPEAYDAMLPSITELVQKYHIDIEVALQVLNPLQCRSCASCIRCEPLKPKNTPRHSIQHASASLQSHSAQCPSMRQQPAH